MNQKSTPNKWLMFIVLLISAITVSLSQLKLAPVLGDVAAMLNVDMTQASLLMSLFTVAGIVLSIPGAAVMAKTGSKNMLLVLMACLVVGNVMGAITNSFTIVMISRIIEGISYALIITVGIDLINTWFSGAQVGTATGIFNTFAAAANFIGMNASVALFKSSGLKILWWAVAILAAICFVLVLLFIQVPKVQAAPGAIQERGATLGEAVKNPALLTVCLLHLCLSFVLFGFITCYPYIFGAYGISQTTSAFLSSLNGLFGIPVCIICGIVVGKTGKPFAVCIIGAIGCALTCFFIPHLGTSMVAYVIHVIASAIFPGGLVMTSVFIIVPQLAKRPALIGLSMGLLNTLYYIGVFLSTPVLNVLAGPSTSPSDWNTGSLLMPPAALSFWSALSSPWAWRKSRRVTLPTYKVYPNRRKGEADASPFLSHAGSNFQWKRDPFFTIQARKPGG